MADTPRLDILLTTDDGIESPGLAATADALGDLGDVTVVAPAVDRSGVGRLRSDEVSVEDHERGVVVDGTPADCAAYGLRGLDESFDLVVSGCNNGPNVGTYYLGRSGTVGAAMEAAFLGTPAVATSAYHPTEYRPHAPHEYDYSVPVRTTALLVGNLIDTAAFREVDLVNINVPTVGAERARITHHVGDFDTGVEVTESGVEFVDRFWGRVGADDSYDRVRRARDAYERGSDRRALIDGAVSVTPLSLPYSHCPVAPVERAVESLDESLPCEVGRP